MSNVSFVKTMSKSVLFVFVLFVLAGPSQILAAEGITGNWEIKMDSNGQESFAELSISKNPDGSFAGTWGDDKLSDVKFEGQKLTFVRILQRRDQEFKTTFEGVLKDGKLTGKLTSDRGTSTAEGYRPRIIPAAVGQWDMKIEVGDREFDAKLVVSQGSDGELTGKWISGRGEDTISKVKFENGKLTFTRKSTYQDRQRESTYEGTVKGNDLVGKSKSERGEVVCNGRRAGGEMIGKWEFTSTSERGTRTNTLTIYPDMTGRYQSFGGAIAIKDLKLEGSQVTFGIDMGFGERSFNMTFEGKLQGSTLNGKFITSRGDREVTGKKMAVAAVSSLVGTWELTSTSRDGTPRTQTLTIKEDMTGTYKSQDRETNVENLKIEGDQVSFKIIRRFREREVPMEFKGKLDGETLNGQFITSRDGQDVSRDVTGKKVGVVH